MDTITKVWADEGAIGFYRGFWPPFLGSIFFRTTAFTVYEAFYTKWEKNSAMCTEIPLTKGL